MNRARLMSVIIDIASLRLTPPVVPEIRRNTTYSLFVGIVDRVPYREHYCGILGDLHRNRFPQNQGHVYHTVVPHTVEIALFPEQRALFKQVVITRVGPSQRHLWNNYSLDIYSVPFIDPTHEELDL